MYQYLVGFTSSIKISPFFYIHAHQNILTYIYNFSTCQHDVVTEGKRRRQFFPLALYSTTYYAITEGL